MLNFNSLNDTKLNKLIDVLVHQSKNTLFYDGNLNEGSKTLVKEVVDTINADRTSIWLYSKNKNSIVCQQLYIKSEDKFYQDIVLFEKDFKPYFDALKDNPIIVADDAEKHPATSCFTEVYLKPLGVKSMLDVPILYKGELLGVICIESLTDRVWDKLDVDFAQLLSSLYTFSYSVNEANKLSSIVLNKEIQLTNRMDAINRSNAVIEFDLDGVIKFANDSFLKTMGYSSDEIIGKHHSVFVFEDEKNSEEYDNFWKLLKTGEYFLGNVVRKKKDGSPIYLQSTYNPIIGDDGKPYRVMKIATDVTESYDQKMEIDKKNTYLEHAAKILRHDMHSGINTYIPRGVSSLERRLNPEIIESAKLEAPLKMIKEGLKHTQKVYKGVYEFTNLVKTDVVLSKTECSIQKIMDDYLTSTAYKSQVYLDDNLPTIEVNESLMCTSIDNLIRNGLKYNDSKSKLVKIYSEGDYICIEDNGRGIDQKDFDELSKPYVRKEGQKETGSGLGLNICKAILKEHGFDITAEKLEQGTKLRIKIK